MSTRIGNAIAKYKSMSESYSLAVDAWENNLHYDDYTYKCYDAGYEPLLRPEFHSILKHCQRQKELEHKVTRDVARWALHYIEEPYASE